MHIYAVPDFKRSPYGAIIVRKRAEVFLISQSQRAVTTPGCPDPDYANEGLGETYDTA